MTSDHLSGTTRFHQSILFRNTLAFLVIMTLVVLPLVYAHLHDVEHALREGFSVELTLAARHSTDMLDPDKVALLVSPIWDDTLEYRRVVQTLRDLQENFRVDNAVIYRRISEDRFVYVADGNRQFPINSPVSLHDHFPGTLNAAIQAWDSGVLGATNLFQSGDNEWYQINQPLKSDSKVVAILMLNKFATPVAMEIAFRQRTIIIISGLVMLGGLVLSWWVTRRQLHPLLTLQEASREISRGNFNVAVPKPGGHSEIGQLTRDFGHMVTDLRRSRKALDDYQNTLEKRVEEGTREIRTLIESQLSQSQKLEAIGSLSGGIAHDFNNILTPIIGYTQMTLGELPKDGRPHEFLGHVLKASMRARDLIAQILQFTRKSDHKRQPVMIDTLVKEVLRLMRSTLPTTIDIRQETVPDLPQVEADTTGLYSVLMNLCINASHAMPDGGVLQVSLGILDLDGSITPGNAVRGVQGSGRHVVLEVQDTGTGMDERTKTHLFEPFFTTKAVGEGTGLGLATVKGIVEDHGGFLSVESQVGVGSIFRVFLPAEPPAEMPPDTERMPVKGGKERVLFVEDEDEIRMLGRISLESLGYRVTTAATGLEALRMFERHGETFDIIVSDQTTPNLTGERLFAATQALRPGLAFVLVSGLPDSVPGREAVGDPPFYLLNKPYTRDDLGRIVREALDKKA